MVSVKFKTHPKVFIFKAIFLLGLLAFVYIHHNGGRTTEFYVFLVLSFLALSLFTLKQELMADLNRKLVITQRKWMGLSFMKVVVRISENSKIALVKDVVSGGSRGQSTWHDLRLDGEILTGQVPEERPFPVIQKEDLYNKKLLEKFAKLLCEKFNLELIDER